MEDKEFQGLVLTKLEALTDAVSGLADIGQLTNQMVGELREALMEKPASDLADLLRQIEGTLKAIQINLALLPKAVAREINGEVD